MLDYLKSTRSYEQNCALEVINTFGSVSRPSLGRFIHLINKSEKTTNQILSSALSVKPSPIKTSFIKTKVLSDYLKKSDSSGMYAFEAFVSLLEENPDAVANLRDLQVDEGKFPYNFVATIGDTLNLFCVLEYGNSRRLNHYNLMKHDNDSNQVMIVVAPTNCGVDVDTVAVEGPHRIAKIGISSTGQLSCTLSEVKNNK